MTYSEVKNILQNIRGKKRRVKALRDYIRKEREALDGVSAVKYDNLAVKSSSDNGTEVRYIKSLDRLNDLEKHYDDLNEDIHNDENLIFRLMESLSPTEYEVILHRFLEGLTVNRTANVMYYQPDGIKDAQTRAIKKMSKN